MAFAPAPEFDPFRLRRLLAGRCVSVGLFIFLTTITTGQLHLKTV